MRKHPNSHREAKATAPVLDSTRFFARRWGFERNRDVSPTVLVRPRRIGGILTKALSKQGC
jgi:hypothetical protein